MPRHVDGPSIVSAVPTEPRPHNVRAKEVLSLAPIFATMPCRYRAPESVLLSTVLWRRPTWEGLQILALSWNCFMVPFRLSFFPGYGSVSQDDEAFRNSSAEKRTEYDFLLYLFLVGDIAADLLLILDLLMQRYIFRSKFDPRLSSIVMPEAELVLSSTHERQREERMTSHEQYRKKVSNWIFLVTSIICAMPLDYIVYAANPDANKDIALALRLIKFLRLLHVEEQSNVIFLMLERRRLIVNAGMRRMILLWAVFFFFAHWFACGFFAVAFSAVRQEPHQSWAQADGLLHYNATTLSVDLDEPTIHAYVRSIYWAIITMVTVGLGDVVPASNSGVETSFTLITMYTGMTLTCLVIGNLTNMVANLDADEDEFHTKMDNMNKYMAYRHLSTDLRDRIRAYYTYMWTSLKGVNEAKFLRDLPITLQLQVAGLRSKDLVTQVHFLRKLRDPIINSICVALEQVIVSPGDYVARAGQNMPGCYWLRRGEAEIISPGGAVLAQLSGKLGSFMGEMALFFPGNFENSIRAKSYCEFFFLKKELFEDIMAESLEEEEFEEIRMAAEKAAKRSAKVKKFFGLDTNTTKSKSWRDILEPRSRFREIWNALNFFGVAYMSMIGPYRLATQTYLFADDVRPGHFVVDWFLDCLFVIDVVFRARFFGFVQEGVVVRDGERIFQRYKRIEPWITDLIVIMPLDLIAVYEVTWLPILRLNKILRIEYLMSHYDTAQTYMAARRITLSNGLHRIVKIFFWVIWCVHVVGCGWMVMSLISWHHGGLRKDERHAYLDRSNCAQTDDDWVCKDHANWANIDHTQPGVTYLRAIYFVLVDMTTVGYGDLVPYNTRETAYVAFITFIGGLGYPAVVGAMAALISSLDTARTEFQNKLAVLTQYMAVKKFPRPLRVRIMRYYDYLWSRQRGVDEDSILHDLPNSLRMEVQEYINGSIMRNITFLQDVDQELLRHLLSVLQPSVFLPGDFIITAGELGQDMFLLEKGATRVTSANGKLTYAVLTPGDYFGEGSLLGLEKRTANVIAIGYCDCFVLNKEDFDRVTREFPQQRELVLMRLRATLQEKRLKNAAIIENMDRYSKLAVITSYEYEERKTVPETSWRHPESGLRRAWDVAILLAILYNFATVPVRLALNAGLTLFAVDYTLDVFLAIDVYCRYKYFGFLDGGQVFTDRDDIRSSYFRSGVLRRDVLTTLPFDVLALISLFINPESEDFTRNLALAMACCRIPKLLLVLRVPKLKANLDTLFSMSRFRDYGAMYRLFLLVVAVIAISHWTGCFFYAIAYYEQSDDDAIAECVDRLTADADLGNDDIIKYSADSCPEETFFTMKDNWPQLTNSDLTCGATFEAHCRWNQTWIQNQMEMGLLPLDGGSLDHRYLRAMNWALPTLVVVVIGDTIPVDIPGTLYVTIMIIIGVTINAAIIGSIANLVANLEGSAAKYREKMDTFERFLYMYQVPQSLQQRTRNYLEYLWETEKDAVQANLVDQMPATLRAEVSNYLKLKFVIHTPFFEFCDTALSKGIAAKLKSEVYSPHDFIIYEGDVGTEMYFIEQGTVQMVSFRGNWRSGHRASSVAVDPGSPAGVNQSNPSLNSRILSERIKSNGSQSPVGGPGVVKQPSLSSLRSGAHSTKRASLIAIEGQIGEEEIIVLASLDAGAYFGETAVFFNERRSCSARALDFTELFALHREDLDEVLLRYPHQADRMFSVVSELRENNQLRNDNLRTNMEAIIAGSKMLDFMSEKRPSFSAGSILDYGRRMLTKRASFLKTGPLGITTGSRVYAAGAGSAPTTPKSPQSPKSPPMSPSNRTNGFGSTLYKSLMYSSLRSAGPTPAVANKKYGIDGKPVPKLSHHLVSDSRMRKKRQKAAAKKARIYRPNETFCRVWNMASLFFTMYFAFSIPFRFAFFADGRPPLMDHKMTWGVIIWFGFEYCIDIFFMVDIFMRYKRFAINRYGKVITNETLIAEHYWNTWLFYDLAASFPADIFAWAAFLSGNNDSHITLLSAVRFLHLLRLLRVHGYSKLLDKYIHELFPRINSSVISVIFLFTGMLLLNHWAACTWFILHRYVESDLHKTWAIADGLAQFITESDDPEAAGSHNIFNEDLNPSFVYLRALYFTVTTMSSVGYGDIRPYTLVETIHELVVVVLGACTFAALIGSVAVVFLHWDSRGEISFKNRLRKLLDFMAFRELPGGLQREIIDHFTNHWERFEGVDMHDVIVGLPLPLQLELAMCIHHDIMDKVRGLRKCHIHVQRHIARKLRMQICSKGEYVFREGEIGHDIYFIRSGELEVTSTEKALSQSQRNLSTMPSHMSVRKKGSYTLRAGHHFGGECLYSLSGERTMTVQCTEACELAFIPKDEFERIMVEFPEHRSIGIFAELVHPERRTMKQSKELHRQVAEIAGSVQTPLGRFSARHIANILGNPNTKMLREHPRLTSIQHTLIQSQLQDDTILHNPKSRKSFATVAKPLASNVLNNANNGGSSGATSLRSFSEKSVSSQKSGSKKGSDWVEPREGRRRTIEERDQQFLATRQLSKSSEQLAKYLKDNNVTERRATVFRGTRKGNMVATIQRGSFTYEDAQDFLAYTRQTGDSLFALDALPVLSPQHLERRQTEFLLK
ncbi:Cyclic nucleotide-gated cation channel [Hondaea fermentalgiana]|uniref:Cyclic nucleotide-gated cation channel n=1 Tax=Hondaea fermentalgiana TaxID=2315210 RepID=A0A2R5GFT1_9STRA|nr:Cyclic nucleotide-gated cation channel [Hondaea fermentalgiana]|eukprot:GBG27111.1 Cyclic nucleotide-gated cation channel [Hondaea fermentalgiana]